MVAERIKPRNVVTRMCELLEALPIAEREWACTEGTTLHLPREVPVTWQHGKLTAESWAEGQRLSRRRKELQDESYLNVLSIRKAILELLPGWTKIALRSGINESSMIQLTAWWNSNAPSPSGVHGAALLAARQVELRAQLGHRQPTHRMRKRSRTASKPTPKHVPAVILENPPLRLRDAERTVLRELLKHECFERSTNRPNQGQIAVWVGRATAPVKTAQVPTALKTALSRLVARGLIDNERHHGKGGGYFLTERGEQQARKLAESGQAA